MASSPWSGVPQNIPCSLLDVQDEQLALSIQEEEDANLSRKISDAGLATVTSVDCSLDAEAAVAFFSPSEDTSSDAMLAALLQRELDRENDQQLLREERQQNKDAKIGISLCNFRSIPAVEEEDLLELSEGEEASDIREFNHWRKVYSNSEKPKFNRRGLSQRGNEKITKHDAEVNGKRNAQKVMEQLDTEINTGDGEGFDMRLSNRVYNSLKRHAGVEEQRAAKLHEKKEHSTVDGAVDERTREMLMKLENSGLLSEVNGCVSTGKEACVFHARGGEGTTQVPNVPEECALKIYRTSLNEFKTRSKYVVGDYRFPNRLSHKNPRAAISIWAEKELTNLNRMVRAGLPCPEPVLLRKHVLVMTFLGNHGQPAPKLNEANLSHSQLNAALRQCIDIIERMYRDCSLVHADLSPYNLLWHRSQLWVIDVSQSVDLAHPEASRFLLRDCTRCCQFFESMEADDVPSPYELFNHVAGLDIKGEGEEFLSQVPAHKPKNQLPGDEPLEEPDFNLRFSKAQIQSDESDENLTQDCQDE